MSETKAEDKISEDVSHQWKPFTDKTGRELTSEEVDLLPEVVRRIRALKKLQFQKQEVDGELEKAILKLIENEFHHKYKSIFAKRAQLISGSAEPTDKDCEFEIESQESGSSIASQVDQPIIQGVPGFWLRALQNYRIIRDWIVSEDEPALNHLIDIAVTYSENPSKFVLEFRFKPNDYFTNEVLTKEYEIRFGTDPKDKWDIFPYFAIKRKGCLIDWKDGKKLIPEKPGDDEYPPSFFCFFDPPEEPIDECESNEELEDILWEDWTIGQTIIRNLVPNALLCYTGHLAEDGSDSESDSSDYSETASEESEDHQN